MTHHARRRLAPALIVLAGTLVGGCVHGSTEAITLGGAVRVGAVEPLEPTDVALDAHAGLDRDAWPATIAAVGADPTTRLASFRTAPIFTGDSPRQTGAWPTPDSAASADAPSALLLIEAVAAPIRAAFEIVTLPLRSGRAPAPGDQDEQ